MGTRQLANRMIDPAPSEVAAGGQGTRAGTPPGMLGMPLYYKLIVANGVVAVAAIIGCSVVVAHAVRANPQIAPMRVTWPIVLVAVLVGGAANALLVRLALKPLRNLAEAATKVREGAENARALPSPLADAEMAGVLDTFNGMLDSVSEYRRRLREIAIRAIDASESERLRISRALHDGTAQSLAALLVQLKVLRASADPVTASALEDISKQVATVIEELRSFAQEMRPPALDMIGLSAAILAHVRNVCDVSGIRIDTHVDSVDGILSKTEELALYRLIQEALMNVVRHSDAGVATLTVSRTPLAVTATVTDNGQGFDVNSALAAGSLGLFGMHERAAYAGGHVTVTSAPGEGTTVHMEIPVRLS